MPSIIGNIVAYDGETLCIKAPFRDVEFIQSKAVKSCEVILNDERHITAKQRRKIFFLISSITDWWHGKQSKKEYAETLRHLKLLYIQSNADSEIIRQMITLRYCELCDIDVFSLSGADVTTARHFIDWLVEIAIENDIPCNDTLLNYAEDIGRYIYACCLNRKCAICGKKADIHHVDAVGMGHNRNDIHNLGRAALPLCRKHHSEAHTIGNKVLCEKYHLQTIKLDEKLCKKLKLKL